MDPTGYLADVERTPATLRALADALGSLAPLPVRASDVDSVVLLGMGSSAYAAGVVAARLRAAGVQAVAELASSTLLPPATERTLVVAVSASGSSAETVTAAGAYAGRSRLVAVTEVDGSPVTAGAERVLPLLAGPEPGGVSCRSYRHTLAVLLHVAEQLVPGVAADLGESCRRAADATDGLLERREQWLPDVADRLSGPHGCWVVGPAHRLSSAQQSALMLREGPRVPAHACETGDWSHVDVYLTRTLDYRMLLLPGSPYDTELLRWTAERGSTVVTVAAANHEGTDVQLLTETTVAELVAHRWWVGG